MKNKDPNFNRHAGIVTLPEPGHPNRRRPIRVDEDGIEIYADDALPRISRLGQDKPKELAHAGILSWDQATRKLDEERSRVPARVTVDPSCATIPAAFDPTVQKTALKALSRSVNDEAAGTTEIGFFASENILDDGYQAGPTFSSGQQHKILLDQISRRKPGLARSLVNGTYPPSLFVHTHPNYDPPSPVSESDGLSADALDIPVAAIDKAGTLYCVLPKRK